MIYSDIDESFLFQYIVYPVGNSFLDLSGFFVFITEIIDVHVCGFPLSHPLSPVIFELPNLFCFLTVNREDGKSLELHFQSLHIDMLKLGIAVRMITPT